MVVIKIRVPTSIQAPAPEILTTWNEAEGQCKDGVYTVPVEHLSRPLDVCQTRSLPLRMKLQANTLASLTESVCFNLLSA